MEHFTQALHTAHFTRNSLRDALMMAGAVQGLALLPLIDRAAALAGDIERLMRAVSEDDKIDEAMAAAREKTA